MGSAFQAGVSSTWKWEEKVVSSKDRGAEGGVEDCFIVEVGEKQAPNADGSAM